MTINTYYAIVMIMDLSLGRKANSHYIHFANKDELVAFSGFGFGLPFTSVSGIRSLMRVTSGKAVYPTSMEFNRDVLEASVVHLLVGAESVPARAGELFELSDTIKHYLGSQAAANTSQEA